MLQPLLNAFKPKGRFRGGIQLTEHKALSQQQPLRVAPIPEKLVLPLGQHIGQSAKPLVAVGDRVLKGQLIAEAVGLVSAPIHASSSGTVEAIEVRSVAHPSGLRAPCVVIATDGQDEAAEPLPHTERFNELSAAEIRDRIRAAGIVGLGGAAFPSAVKLNSSDRRLDKLILNGAECEPYITCDAQLSQDKADEVVAAIPILRLVLEANNLPVIIALEDNMPEGIAALRAAVETAKLRRVEVRAVPSIYPEGGEKQLIQTLTGMEVPTGGLPLDIGLVVQNIGTARAVYRAIVHGEPLTDRYVTVTGAGVQSPGNFVVKFGTPIYDLIAAAGGYQNTDAIGRLIMGGPMMGFALQADDVPIVKATNCILVANREEVRPDASHLACIRCGECAEVCPASLLPQQLYWHSRAREFDKTKDYNLFDCIECGACAQACPSHIPLVQYYRFAKTEIWAAQKERNKSDHARERFETRQQRQEREIAEKAARAKQRQAAIAAEAKRKQVDSTVAPTAATDPAAIALAKAKAARAGNGSAESAGNEATKPSAANSAIERAKAAARKRQQQETEQSAGATNGGAAAALAKAKAAAAAKSANASASPPTAAEQALAKAKAAAAKSDNNESPKKPTAAEQALAKAKAPAQQAAGEQADTAALSPAQLAIAKAKAAAASKNTDKQAPAKSAEALTPAQQAIAKAKSAAAAKQAGTGSKEASTASAENEQASNKPELTKPSAAELAIVKARAKAKAAAAAKQAGDSGSSSSESKADSTPMTPAQAAIAKAKAAALAKQAANKTEQDQ